MPVTRKMAIINKQKSIELFASHNHFYSVEKKPLVCFSFRRLQLVGKSIVKYFFNDYFTFLIYLLNEIVLSLSVFPMEKC